LVDLVDFIIDLIEGNGELELRERIDSEDRITLDLPSKAVSENLVDHILSVRNNEFGFVVELRVDDFESDNLSDHCLAFLFRTNGITGPTIQRIADPIPH
jgi:hypothetical protein